MFLRSIIGALFGLFFGYSATAGSIEFNSFNFTDIPQSSMQTMLENIDSIYGSGIEKKFKKNIRYLISSSSGGQAYVDPYSSLKEVRLVMMIPYDAKEPEILATLCHEVGHLVSKGRHGNWIRFNKTVATEGQSDYFVPSCMKLYMDKFHYLPQVEIDQDVFDACLKNSHQQFTNTECTVILQSFKNIFSEYNPEISYDKSSGKKSFLTNRGHPDEQCRLDTVKDSVLGKGRNRCWFNPIFPSKPRWRDLRIIPRSQPSRSQPQAPDLLSH